MHQENIRRRSCAIGLAFLTADPRSLKKLDKSEKHCRFIGRARSGEGFYVPRGNISCPLARFCLGIGKTVMGELAETLTGWDDAVNDETAVKYLRAARRLERAFKCIAYFPVPFKSVEPEIIIRIGTPDAIQRVVQRYSSLTGKRVPASLSGIGAACGECTSYPLVTGEPNVSLGCYGSRPGIGLNEEELLLAAPFRSRMGEIIMEGIDRC